MAHSGSIIAAGFGKGRINFCDKKKVSVSTSYNKQDNIWTYFNLVKMFKNMQMDSTHLYMIYL